MKVIKILAVLDTNVLVSAALKPPSIPGIIVDKAMQGEITPVLNEKIISEYERVLHSKKFNFPDEKINNMIGTLKERGIFLNEAEITDKVLHDTDVVFYAVTMEALEDKESVAYLVTGNKKHFPIKKYVVSPREFFYIIMDLSLKH